ncbi:rab-GTPase-TBC domain-containing protein [Hirsutella rhossiliensis]|uniref:Rab-GTPase-TBC domain-containing protein n=1 Tax=Hirsutella rhossiliensis TaxID=111463 RepID=A0A9P8N3M1_9HYPO|nr:rab-GTPase-TBC domain-containing protein [Hirsutella rhossiliensis]KAH0966285.1 rab-GTPase-TBC domain-containing protein [Hirsutella rhossiliensis]
MTMDASSPDPAPSSQPLARSVSQHSAASARSHRSARRSSRNPRLPSQPSSSASSIAPSDKSLTSFPSFSPDSPTGDRFDDHPSAPPKSAAPCLPDNRRDSTASARALSMVDNLAGRRSARDALFEDAPLRQSVPGALHQAPDGHIERLVARHGAVALVRQIAEDLAQRDVQIASLRRRADERERALRKIVRECGLSNLDLETRLRAVETELRANDRAQASDNDALCDLMSDAMRDTVSENAYGETHRADSTIRATGASLTGNATPGSTKGTMRGWKDYLWGTGTAKKHARTNSINGDGRQKVTASSTIVRSHSSMDRRPTLQEDLFNPPTPADPASVRSSSRASSIRSANASDPKPSASLASLALRLVAGGTGTPRETDARGRAASPSRRAASARAGSAAPASTKAQAQDVWGTGKPSVAPQESYGPVEMDAILPPESQPPTMTSIHANYATSEFLTDSFGFIYDQRRKKRQREAAHMAQNMRNGSRAEMLNGRSGISPSLLEEASSLNGSVSDDGRPESPGSAGERGAEDKPKRWQDYLRIATFPTELLSHTPSMSGAALEVMEGTDASQAPGPTGSRDGEPLKSPGITPTGAGLVPLASTTTAVDSEAAAQPPEADATTVGTLVKEDVEPVRLLLEQLSDVHDSLQRDKMVKWNDFLRKVRAERRREGEAAVAAAAAVAEARYETPAMILPETRVADGEMIGISDLGNKGKVGRAKWNEFKTLVLSGIPVAYRAKIWSECSGANALRIPGYYEDLVSQGSDGDDPAVVSQIQMDIHRTLTDNIFFRKGPGVQKLNEVLLAYSRRNTEVGYCQGMNLIAANLLLITPSAEDAFWVLASMVESILPDGYYDHSLMPSRADQQVLRQYVSTVLPKLSAHLDSLSIELEALTFQWFLSVFTDCLCAEALFRVWDVVLCTNDGSTFLFQVALALLKLNETNLLERDSAAGVYTYINHQMTEHAISIDGLIQASEGLRRVVRREDVEQRRDKAMQAEKDLVAQRNGDWDRRDARDGEVVAESGESWSGPSRGASPGLVQA